MGFRRYVLSTRTPACGADLGRGSSKRRFDSRWLAVRFPNLHLTRAVCHRDPHRQLPRGPRRLAKLGLRVRIPLSDGTSSLQRWHRSGAKTRCHACVDGGVAADAARAEDELRDREREQWPDERIGIEHCCGCERAESDAAAKEQVAAHAMIALSLFVGCSNVGVKDGYWQGWERCAA